MNSKSMATPLLKKQLSELQKESEGFSVGLADDSNLFIWEVMVFGPSNSAYDGGYFKAHLLFPQDYPQLPPKMKFLSDMWHPNIYPNGEVCISILHPPGDDEHGYEKACERWTPVQTIYSILISVICMLSSPNIDSPANVDAAVSNLLFVLRLLIKKLSFSYIM